MWRTCNSDYIYIWLLPVTVHSMRATCLHPTHPFVNFTLSQDITQFAGSCKSSSFGSTGESAITAVPGIRELDSSFLYSCCSSRVKESPLPWGVIIVDAFSVLFDLSCSCLFISSSSIRRLVNKKSCKARIILRNCGFERGLGKEVLATYPAESESKRFSCWPRAKTAQRIFRVLNSLLEKCSTTLHRECTVTFL